MNLQKEKYLHNIDDDEEDIISDIDTLFNLEQMVLTYVKQIRKKTLNYSHFV